MNTISSFFKELKELFPDQNIPDFLGEAEKIYTSSVDLSEATFRLVHFLFERFGLIIVDPDKREWKKLLKPVMVKDILERRTIKILNNTNQILRKKKYKAQVNGREINFFYLSTNGRQLITPVKDGYEVGDQAFFIAEAEMKDIIANTPELLSPNVVLRPVYQELILPNLAYIGGPGEMSYWLQLKEVFGIMDVHFPMLVLRNSFCVITPRLKHFMEQLGLENADYFKRVDRLRVDALKSFIHTNEEEAARVIDQTFQQLIDEMNTIDNQLSSSLLHRKKEMQDFFVQFSRKIRKSKSALEKKKMEKLAEIRDALFPSNTPAERVNNMLHYLTANDHEAFIDAIYSHSEPITNSVKLISY
jgi:bacillithiol biosynthesis cysteine-adding enzyme BshC